MLTLHAVERYMERVMRADVDKDFIISNFYHLEMMIKDAYRKAEFIYEGAINADTSETNKYYLYNNIVFIVSERGIILTIMTININEEIKTKYRATILELRDLLSSTKKQLDEKKSLALGFEKLSINGFSQLSPLINITATEIEELENKVEALEVMLKMVCKALLYNRYTCTNRNIAETYKQELFKNNINTNSIEVKTIEKLILSDLYKVQVSYNKH